MKLAVIILLIIAIAYLGISFGITCATFKQNFDKFDIDMSKPIAHWDFYKDRYLRREVTFDSEGNKLNGYIFEAEKPKGLIVFSHGIWSGVEEYLTLITWFVDHDWTVFSYSYTAYNGSEGARVNGLPKSPIDLDNALKYVESDPELNQLPRVLMGHSWGAYASTAVLTKGHDADAVVALSGFSDPVEISTSIAAGMVGPLGKTLGWEVNLIDKIYFGKESRRLAVDGINAVDIPILLEHGENDLYIKFQEASIIKHRNEITNPKVEYLILTDPKQSGHENFFTNRDAFDYYQEINQKYEDAAKKFKGQSLPDAEKAKIRTTIDFARISQPNAELYEKIERFLEQAVFAKS